MCLPGVPMHVVLRGHNRGSWFFADEDFLHYQHLLAEGMTRYGSKRYALCRIASRIDPLLMGKPGIDLFFVAHVHVTASSDIAQWPADGCDAQPLFYIADRGLYSGKRAGRNGVVGPGGSASSPLVEILAGRAR